MKYKLYHTVFFLWILLFLWAQPGKIFSQTLVPTPDHIVVVIMENHGYDQIIDAAAAPHISSLAHDDHSALFTQSFAIEHPSQPNYFDLFAGCNQGIMDDSKPTNLPFTTDNLGWQLIDAGRTFLSYSEDLPSVGYDGNPSGNYARKHNPASNWMGTGTNQFPKTTNQPFTAFPTDFSLLPTVSFVIPNLKNDMHDGGDPGGIITGDTWIYQKLFAYIQWAKTHNSLLILTFDEDEGFANNKIATIFSGQMVKSGQYSETINHYTVLRTIEEMYGLPYACNASTAIPITDSWIFSSSVRADKSAENIFSVYPNPSNGEFTVEFENSRIEKLESIEIINVLGEIIFSKNFTTSSTKEISLKHFPAGDYLVKIKDGKAAYTQKLVVQ